MGAAQSDDSRTGGKLIRTNSILKLNSAIGAVSN